MPPTKKVLPRNTQNAEVVLFFDTETTGLVNHKLPASDPSQPYLLQLGLLLAKRRDDFSYQSLFEYGALVCLPIEASIHPKAQAVHGISKDLIELYGEFPEDMLNLFLNKQLDADLVVAHNASFAKKVLEAVACRLGFIEELFPDEPFCTMLSTTELCKLPGRWGKPKWPELQELHKFLFGVGFEGAHDALTDVRATARCFFELQRREAEDA